MDADGEKLTAAAHAISAEVDAAQIRQLQADVADYGRAEEAVQLTLTSFGKLDILVNNAAARNYSPLGAATPEEWSSIVGVNLVGAANYCRAALPAIRKSRGSIINVSSCYAVAGRAGMGLYDATKAGLLAMTRTLAFEEAKQNVRANAICPGSTLTDFHVNRAASSGISMHTLKIARRENSLIGRWAEPKEIAWPILWLASDEASFITGVTLMVDGGLSIM
ncbi:short-chain dehydrogenase [Hydrogenophaga sp. PBC]|uniref:SDR family NAD(P)-dependent oxidoreductase n=1 Tax=Hydrogenophaga sp. PBC TaxID=795665 RepID=UPI0002F336DE|nr:SDR family oxidoreductase [Hydrogenophaga sp. PBC]AOS81183.1 short-chain dehydrogenase [Hydrogenophaga sp. PBC]